jgi:acetyltransferase-like isoleucine patch superfamily enzyme
MFNYKNKITSYLIKILSSKKMINYFLLWKGRILDNYYRQALNICGTNVHFRYPLVIENAETVEIGDNVSLAPYIHIWGSGGVKIGSNTMIASHVAIFSVTHDYNEKNMHETIITQPVVIEENVWIGTHAIIFPGIKIGRGAVIGAGALVNKNVPENTIFYGIPGAVRNKRKTKI